MVFSELYVFFTNRKAYDDWGIYESKPLKLNQYLMGECFRDTSEMQMTGVLC